MLRAIAWLAVAIELFSMCFRLCLGGQPIKEDLPMSAVETTGEVAKEARSVAWTAKNQIDTHEKVCAERFRWIQKLLAGILGVLATVACGVGIVVWDVLKSKMGI